MSHSAEIDARIQRAVRTLLPGLSVARYSERWSPESPAVQAFDILAEWVGRDPYPDAEKDAQEAHVTTEYARSRGMVTVTECDAEKAGAWDEGYLSGWEDRHRDEDDPRPAGDQWDTPNPYRVTPPEVGAS